MHTIIIRACSGVPGLEPEEEIRQGIPARRLNLAMPDASWNWAFISVRTLRHANPRRQYHVGSSMLEASPDHASPREGSLYVSDGKVLAT